MCNFVGAARDLADLGLWTKETEKRERELRRASWSWVLCECTCLFCFCPFFVRSSHSDGWVDSYTMDAVDAMDAIALPLYLLVTLFWGVDVGGVGVPFYSRRCGRGWMRRLVELDVDVGRTSLPGTKRDRIAHGWTAFRVFCFLFGGVDGEVLGVQYFAVCCLFLISFSLFHPQLILHA